MSSTEERDLRNFTTQVQTRTMSPTERALRKFTTYMFLVDLLLLLILAYAKSAMLLFTAFLTCSILLLSAFRHHRIGRIWINRLDRFTFYIASHVDDTVEIVGEEVAAFAWHVKTYVVAFAQSVAADLAVHEYFESPQSQTNSPSDPQRSQISAETIDCPKENIETLRGQGNLKPDEIWQFLDVLKEKMREEVESTVEKMKQETEGLRGEVNKKLGEILKYEENIVDKVEARMKEETDALREQVFGKLEETRVDQENIVHKVEEKAEALRLFREKIEEAWGFEVKSRAETLGTVEEYLKYNQLWEFLDKMNLDLGYIEERVNFVADNMNLVPQETWEIRSEEGNQEGVSQRNRNRYSSEEGEVDWNLREGWSFLGRPRGDEEEEMRCVDDDESDETGDVSVEEETESVVAAERRKWAEEKAEILAELRDARASAKMYKALWTWIT